MQLDEIIINRIQSNGPVSFREFMDMALYYPQLGYYTSGKETFGKNGDYYTSPYYTGLFGQMIAKQLEEMWHKVDNSPFTIVEYGPGSGLLCQDILTELQKVPELFEKVQYCIIEKGSRVKDSITRTSTEKITSYGHISEVPPFTGCILSNELLDNFAVHQVIMQEELMEVFVGYDKGFYELLVPASAECKNYFEELGVVLPKGFRTEVNLAALAWMQEVATPLQKGFVLTIDYGNDSSRLYQDSRREGTLVCYHKHKVNFNYYQNIGSQDITAHVNFSALKHWGRKIGLQFCGFTSQAYFLMGLGLSMHARTQAFNEDAARFLQTFLLDMGAKLKVLIQQKGLENPKLSGMNFSQQLF